MVSDDEQVLRLEQLAAEASRLDPEPVPAETLFSMVESLIDGNPLSYAATLLPEEQGGDRESRALDIMKGYGSWLAKVKKSTPQVPCVFACDLDTGLRLFEPESPPGAPEGAVVLPAGYERIRSAPGSKNSTVGKDALVTLLFYRPSSEEAARYTHSLLRRRKRPLSFEMVSAVWGFTRRGRILGLAAIDSDARFLELSVEAYRLLETYRSDAIKALRRLSEYEGSDPEEVLELLTRCYWLAEPEAARVRAAAERRSAKEIDASLRLLASRTLSGSVRLPASVRDLDAGQVLRVGVVSGLVDDDNYNAHARQLRSRLRDIGISKDLDKLVQDAFNAERTGDEDMFWEAMSARAAGDPTWSDMLSG